MNRLFPAAVGTAAFAAVAHAALVAIAARSIGAELLVVAALSFVVALVVALAGGAVLLLAVQAFRLGLAASLLLFVVAVQAISIGLELVVFEIGLDDVSWQYAFISVPSALLAWYLSIYRAHRSQGGGECPGLGSH